MSKLYVAKGKDVRKMTRQLLERIRLEQYIGKDHSIGLKPNLVISKTYKSGATTNPVICEEVIEYLLSHGRRNVFVLESSWIGDSTKRAFKVCGYEALAKKYGIELVDVKKDDMVVKEYGGLKVEVSKRALETDYIINLPLIKGHCQTKMTCALKNLKGLISDKEKRRFHTLGLDKPIAYLNKMIRADFIIADGTWIDPTFEEGGNPTALDVMIAGSDPMLLDTYAAELLGFRMRDIGYLKIADSLGIGSSDLGSADIVYVGEEKETKTVKRDAELDRVDKLINQKEACSACYANLVSAMIKTSSKQEVCVGQGFIGKPGVFGSGDCTSCFDEYIQGCPPSVEDIAQVLRKK